MKKLYPLKFTPLLKEKIWGGNKLESLLNKDGSKGKIIGESWELSAVEDNISVVSDGFLQGNNLQDLIEVYMGDLVGDKVYEKYGLEFPLLFKFIDASNDLSIQVHPGDEFAKEKHSAFGKTEMWYIVDAEKDTAIISGFNKTIDSDKFVESLDDNTLKNHLNYIPALTGKMFFIPPGRIHSIGKGVLLAEIQQTSDITYRIYDWNRIDDNGNKRELNIDLAKEVIDLSVNNEGDISYDKVANTRVDIVSNEYFTTSLFDLDKDITLSYDLFDSFIVYMCLEGEMEIDYEDEQSVSVKMGETVLIPAELTKIHIKPKGATKFLEVYII